eukprot:9804616-Lingulodinium_polyedra.AAC.1
MGPDHATSPSRHASGSAAGCHSEPQHKPAAPQRARGPQGGRQPPGRKSGGTVTGHRKRRPLRWTLPATACRPPRGRGKHRKQPPMHWSLTAQDHQSSSRWRR